MLQARLSPDPMRDGTLRLELVGTDPHDARLHLRCYYFGMFLEGIEEMVGEIELRLRDDRDTLLYLGQVGYSVEPDYQGQHLAARSLKLLKPLARRHQLRELWITCDPHNLASRRTCELAGAVFQEVVTLPRGHALYAVGLRQKCRYRLRL
ncbi:MAG: GNAT family N-acetyltransferase [Candidatus Eremiobacteraeota bacterium]|nr:GNAT family N-acetyltransferase [Candidatus Eremiobacteraeota bacterium]